MSKRISIKTKPFSSWNPGDAELISSRKSKSRKKMSTSLTNLNYRELAKATKLPGPADDVSCKTKPDKQLKANQSKTDQSKSGQLKTGQSKTDQPKKGQPKPVQSKTGHLKPGQLRTGQLKPGQVKTGQPLLGQPLPGKPLPDQQKTGQPKNSQSKTGEPKTMQHKTPTKSQDSEQNNSAKTSRSAGKGKALQVKMKFKKK